MGSINNRTSLYILIRIVSSMLIIEKYISYNPITLLVLYGVVGGNRSQCSDTLDAQSDVSLLFIVRSDTSDGLMWYSSGVEGG